MARIRPRTPKLPVPSGQPPCWPDICATHQSIPWADSPACPNHGYEPWARPSYRLTPTRPGEDLVVRQDSPDHWIRSQGTDA